MCKTYSLLKFILLNVLFMSSYISLQAQSKYRGMPKHEEIDIAQFFLVDNYELRGQLPDTLQYKLQQAISELFVNQNIAGLSVTMFTPKGQWQTTMGYANKPNKQFADSSTVFYWASVCKLVTATIIMQLINEKKIKSNSKLSKWYPKFSNAKKITISNLLTHTSGIYSFNSDSNFHNSSSYHTPDELLAIALAKENLFKPNEYWSYSNTGYLLLALIAQKIENKSFAQIVQERIAIPFGLQSLKVLMPNEITNNLAQAHSGDSIVCRNYATPLGAGNIVCNSYDMAKLLYILLSGQLLPKTSLQTMLSDLYPMFGGTQQYYGRGVMVYNFKAIDSTSNLWLGHSGGTENYKAILAYDVKTKAIISVAINENISAEALAYKLFAILRRED